MSVELPSAETLYHHFLAGWIAPDDPRDRVLRSDLEQVELTGGQHIRILSPLNEEGKRVMTDQLHRTTHAALADFPSMLGVSGTPTIDWLTALEQKATPEQIQRWLRSSNPERPDNPWFVLCCETGAIIAEVLKAGWPRFQWLPDTPYFESDLFDLNARIRIPVFHWAVKTLSGDERWPLKDKVAACLDYVRDPSATLPTS